MARRWQRGLWLGLAVLMVAAALGWMAWSRHRGRPPIISPAQFEVYARARFLREHPGEKPLSWAVGAAAARFYRTRPMGRFRLSLTPGVWGNDCSDFVECAIDEGLGVKARFRRGSRLHLVGDDSRYFEHRWWDRTWPLRPGDVVSVAHSPWYEPYEGANWHVGVVGTDGLVYDFVKLRRWRDARYGRHTPEWFVQHSTARRSVLIGRLRPQYDYLLQPVSPGRGHY